MRKASWIPKEDLEEFYKTHSYVETLEHFNIKGGKLDRMVKAYGISKNAKVLENIEQVSKEELEQYYVHENHSKVDTQIRFNLTEYGLSTLFRRYGIRKEREKVDSLRKETSLERYGDENYNGREKFKRTYESRYGGIGFASEIIRTQAENTTKERYGDEDIRKTDYFKQKVSKAKEERYGDPNYNNLEKRKETCLARYGEDNPQKVEEIKEKVSNTCQERYGSRYPQEKVRETKKERYGDEYYTNPELRKRTNLQKYGYEYTFQVPEVKEKVSKTCQEKYGVNWACMRPEARNYSNDSKPNRDFTKLLESNGIEFEREFPIQNRSYDFKVGNVLIEINPHATHNSTWGLYGTEAKPFRYHVEKTILAREHGYQCIHVWDWDDQDKIVRMLLPRQRVYARKCEIREITQYEANRFLKQYHLQGASKMQTACIALFLGGELLQLMTFGKPRFNKKYEWELIRLCTKEGIMVVGGSEKLYKYFHRKYNPESIISYCDMSKFKGDVYLNLGMTQLAGNNPSRHWYNPKENKQLTDNGVRMLGFDKLCGANYGKGTSNDNLLREHGWVEIWDAGQASYIWKR